MSTKKKSVKRTTTSVGSATKKQTSARTTAKRTSATAGRATKAARATTGRAATGRATAGRAARKAGRLDAFERFDAALFDRLLEQAIVVRENAYAPFSGYRVGAAIATRGGTIHVGCNVENSTYGATICAERGAVMQMIAAGQREPVACVIVTSDGASPCGICRQVLAEFADDMPVVLANLDDESGRVVQLAELLPLAFRLTP